MAINLRLPEDLDELVTQRAARDGTSKHAVLLSLIRQHVNDDIDTEAHRAAVRQAAHELLPRWQPVLDRLGKA